MTDTFALAAPPLSIEATVAAGSVDHRLALGLQWIDGLSRLAAAGPWMAQLESIGTRPCALTFDAHPQSRHALRWTGLLARLLTRAAAAKLAMPPAPPTLDPTRFNLRAFAQRDAGATAWSVGGDPRTYVPRRLALIPEQSAGVPAATAANSRQAWLWPGAAYPLPSNTTALTGCVRRGAALAGAAVVPWARVIVTAAKSEPGVLADEIGVGCGHVDDRGEFVVVLGAAAVPGGALLPPALPLHVWLFLPPAAAPGADPLAALPLEMAGTEVLNDVLRGLAPPAGYLSQAPISVGAIPGEVLVMNDADLLFT